MNPIEQRCWKCGDSADGALKCTAHACGMREAHQQAAQDVELPPLPERTHFGGANNICAFTADQMLAFRAEGIAAHQARAWAHEEDPARVISDVQKQQAIRDGGASASSVRQYSIALSAAAPTAQGERDE